MAVIRLADGSEPPFGATVLNARKQETSSTTAAAFTQASTPASA